MFLEIARVIKEGRCLFLDSCQKHGKNMVPVLVCIGFNVFLMKTSRFL